MILFKRTKLTFTLPLRIRLRKKVIIPYYPPLETVQLLFETFINTSTNKQDNTDNKVTWHTWYICTMQIFVPRDYRSKTNEKEGINARELAEE